MVDHKNAIMPTIRSFILERNKSFPPSELDKKLTPDSDFITAGYVDSLLFMELIAFIDDTFNIQVNLGAFERDDMRSLSGFCAAVARQAR